MPIDAAALQQRLAEAFRGELEVTGLLGVGGFAAVFRAHDPVLQRDVAIKVLDASAASLADKQEQFLAEARVVATVEHPHIVPLYGAEVRHGLLCLTMRLIPGRSLAHRIAEGPLAPAEAARLAGEVAEALGAAHARGVIHRDIKPENILIDANGHAIVTDFGISLVTGRANQRVPGMAIGTPQYLSPEQALGEEVDGRTDVYSLGVVLYEMLAGRLPFESATTAGLLAKQILETPPPLDTVRPDLPAALTRATHHALAKSAGERPTASALAVELADARTVQALLPPSVVRRRARWRRLRWGGAVVGVLVGAIGMAAWAAFQGLTTFSGGAQPSLSATDANIPPALIAEAHADGTLEPGEIAEYVFVPAGRPWSEALLVTDRAIVRRAAGAYRRHPAWSGDIDLNITVFRGRRSDRGLIVSAGKGGRPDTLYRGLSGAELGALANALAAVEARHAKPQ